MCEQLPLYREIIFCSGSLGKKQIAWEIKNFVENCQDWIFEKQFTDQDEPYLLISDSNKKVTLLFSTTTQQTRSQEYLLYLTDVTVTSGIQLSNFPITPAEWNQASDRFRIDFENFTTQKTLDIQLKVRAFSGEVHDVM
jgi:hypothetical protein